MRVRSLSLILLWMIILSALITVILYAVTGNFIASGVLGFLSSLFLSIYLLRLGWKRIVRDVDASPISGELFEKIDKILSEYGVKAEIYTFPSEDINSLSISFSGRNYILVSKGAIKRLNDKEMRALILHEIYHILRGDSEYYYILATLFGAPYLFNVFYFLRPTSQMFLLSLSNPKREFVADAFAKKNGGDIYSLLEKVSIYNSGKIARNNALEPLYFVDYFDIFSTHPTLYERINRVK